MRDILLVISIAFLLPAMVAATCTMDSLTQGLNTLVRESLTMTAGVDGASTVLQINDRRVVCLSSGMIRGTYSSVSILLNISCNGPICPIGGMQQQFDFGCDSAGWLTTTNNFATPDGADFTTSLRTDCGECRRLVPSSMMYNRYDNVTHCIECSPICNTGLRECFGLDNDSCCAATENNSCTATCTAPERPLPSDNYTCSIFCDSLTAPLNGMIEQSNGNLLNSVATYTCEQNYKLQGSLNRTCVVDGKSTTWTETAPSCLREMTDSTCVGLKEGENQIISYIGECTVELGCQAVYSCAERYELKGGATVRMCSLPKDGIPVWEGIAPKCEEQSTSLSQAEFAGIGIAVAVVAAFLIIGIVFAVIIILSKQ